MEFTALFGLFVPPVFALGGAKVLSLLAVGAAAVPLGLLLRHRPASLPHCCTPTPSLRLVAAVKSGPA